MCHQLGREKSHSRHQPHPSLGRSLLRGWSSGGRQPRPGRPAFLDMRTETVCLTRRKQREAQEGEATLTQGSGHPQRCTPRQVHTHTHTHTARALHGGGKAGAGWGQPGLFIAAQLSSCLIAHPWSPMDPASILALPLLAGALSFSEAPFPHC